MNKEHRTKNKKQNLLSVICYLLSKKGFTLVELLIVMTLVSIIGIVTTQIFIQGIRSQGKSEVLKEVRQNGDYSMLVIESMVRNAANISETQCNTNSDEITITNQDGYSTTFDCSAAGMASNSGYPVPTPSVSVSLISNKVTVTGCTFRIVCPTPPLNPKYVFVNFTISTVGSGLTPTPGSFSSLEYQTTLSLRNYK